MSLIFAVELIYNLYGQGDINLTYGTDTRILYRWQIDLISVYRKAPLFIFIAMTNILNFVKVRYTSPCLHLIFVSERGMHCFETNVVLSIYSANN